MGVCAEPLPTGLASQWWLAGLSVLGFPLPHCLHVGGRYSELLCSLLFGWRVKQPLLLLGACTGGRGCHHLLVPKSKEKQKKNPEEHNGFFQQLPVPARSGEVEGGAPPAYLCIYSLPACNFRSRSLSSPSHCYLQLCKSMNSLHPLTWSAGAGVLLSGSEPMPFFPFLFLISSFGWNLDQLCRSH